MLAHRDFRAPLRVELSTLALLVGGLLAFAAPAAGQAEPALPDTAVSQERAETAPADTGAAPSDTAAALAATSRAVPQRDVFDVVQRILKGPRVEPERASKPVGGLKWVALPSISYNPLYGTAFGISASGAGRLGDPSKSRISALSLGGNYSTTGQTQLTARGDLYLRSNSILLRIDGRYLDTSRPTWGLGPLQDGQQEYPMDYTLIRTYCTAYWGIGESVYAGLGFHYDDFYDIVDQRAAQGDSTPYVGYAGSPLESSRSTGFSFNLLNDERDNPVNPRRGYYLSASFRSYDLAGDGGEWQEMLADLRAYPRIPGASRNRLAFWLQTWFSFGDTPYLNLPHLGGDTAGRSGRGYVLGRIRSQDLASAEVEYRLELREDGLLGAVAFYSLTKVTVPETGVFARANRAGGAGLRLKFSKTSDTNFTLDAGWGEQDSFGWFIGTTEVF